MRTLAIVAGTTLVAAGLLTTLSVVGTDAAAPVPSVAFDHPRQNAYYPLVPGTVSRLRGTNEGERFRETVTVTRRHKTIQGVRTTGWSSTWSGVRTAPSPSGRTTGTPPTTAGTSGTSGRPPRPTTSRVGWRTARGPGRPAWPVPRRGIIMPASPHPTDAFRQELDRGNAEDQAWIVQRGLTLKVPYGTVRHAVRSFEWTRLEPGVISTKIYAPGLGIVRERDVSGGSETFELVSVSRPR